MRVAARDYDFQDRADAVRVLVAEADDVTEVQLVDQERDAREHRLVGIGGIGLREHHLAAYRDVLLDYGGGDADRLRVLVCAFVVHANRRSHARRTEPQGCNGSCVGLSGALLRSGILRE